MTFSTIIWLLGAGKIPVAWAIFKIMKILVKYSSPCSKEVICNIYNYVEYVQRFNTVDRFISLELFLVSVND